MANGKLQVDTYRDIKGFTAGMRYHVASGGTAITQQTAAIAVATAAVACSNAALEIAHGPNTSNAQPPVFGTAAQYIGVHMKAVYTFRAADGTLHRFQIPAPHIAIFEVDQQTVDAAQADSAAFITAVLANVVTANGSALTSFAGGQYRSRPQSRKLNINIKVPELDEPAE
jgi:hypothetical protein